MRSWLAALGIVAVLWANLPSWAADERAAPPKNADRILIVKSTRTLTLLNHGQVLKSYEVALGGDPVGAAIRACWIECSLTSRSAVQWARRRTRK